MKQVARHVREARGEKYTLLGNGLATIGSKAPSLNCVNVAMPPVWAEEILCGLAVKV